MTCTLDGVRSYEDEIRSVEGPDALMGGPENDYDPFASLERIVITFSTVACTSPFFSEMTKRQ